MTSSVVTRQHIIHLIFIFIALALSIIIILSHRANAAIKPEDAAREMPVTWPDGSVIVEEASPLKRDPDLTPWLIGGGLLLLVAAVSGYVWITKRKRK